MSKVFKFHVNVKTIPLLCKLSPEKYGSWDLFEPTYHNKLLIQRNINKNDNYKRAVLPCPWMCMTSITAKRRKGIFLIFSEMLGKDWGFRNECCCFIAFTCLLWRLCDFLHIKWIHSHIWFGINLGHCSWLLCSHILIG